MHIPPGTAHPEHIEHVVEKQPVVASSRVPATTAPDESPFLVRQITPKQRCVPKGSPESTRADCVNQFVHAGLTG